MRQLREKCAAPGCVRYTRGAFRVTMVVQHTRLIQLDYCTKKHMDEAVRRVRG